MLEIELSKEPLNLSPNSDYLKIKIAPSDIRRKIKSQVAVEITVLKASFFLPSIKNLYGLYKTNTAHISTDTESRRSIKIGPNGSPRLPTTFSALLINNPTRPIYTRTPRA
jgi:hypothetical protein